MRHIILLQYDYGSRDVLSLSEPRAAAADVEEAPQSASGEATSKQSALFAGEGCRERRRQGARLERGAAEARPEGGLTGSDVVSRAGLRSWRVAGRLPFGLPR